ncbi:hypothetical protein HN011_005280 [Eciton burchellii]|nr:hypothetical protein HN011_005280 [Eciton burchellii]
MQQKSEQRPRSKIRSRRNRDGSSRLGVEMAVNDQNSQHQTSTSATRATAISYLCVFGILEDARACAKQELNFASETRLQLDTQIRHTSPVYKPQSVHKVLS